MKNKKTILVIEDDLSILEAYKVGLKVKDFEGIFASSKSQAEKHLDKKFDYAILDGIKGECFELYEKINADKKIIVTADPKIIEECKNKNIKYGEKPISLSEILEK